MKIFLSGGNGMVGRNILDHPFAQRFEFCAPGREELDLLRYEEVLSFLKYERPDIVIHTAGLVGGIRANISRPVDFYCQNLDMGKNLVLAAREAGVNKLLNLGSSCMYPRDARNPLKESSILSGELEPTNEGYGLAKVSIQRLCSYVAQEDDSLEYKTMVPCNLFGPYDKFDAINAHLIPAVIVKIDRAIKLKSEDVEIWGTGDARREFMYAGDLADAVISSLEKWSTLPSVINIGVGSDYSINEYYEAVAKVIGWEGQFVHDLSKPVGMKQKLVDVSLQTAWGWSPVTNLEDGIRKTYEYYLEAMCQ